MLSPVNRLTDSDGFRRAVRSGRRAGSTTLVVHLAWDPDADAGPPQVGFTVSKAVGNAVTRTRVKRRLRHLTREHLPQLEALPGRAALVVRALPAAAEASYASLGADLGRTLERVSRP
ncbi:Ribonuclease P protein component [metagenome]|uniref:Ribonuclease P protein component n=1 Tax=metagenome TaxID=256318 RepID=A0A2P2CK24_9ZZZZ